MDPLNRFHTDSSWRQARLEALGVLVAAVAAAAWQLDAIRWGPFVLAFVAIDLIGYLPGAIAHRRAGGAPIAPIYHHLYALTHSPLTAGLAVGLWALAIGGLEPAMLAVPIHLAGDRGLFGNASKPVELPFEPRAVDPLPHLRPPTPAAARPAAPVLQEVE